MNSSELDFSKATVEEILDFQNKALVRQIEYVAQRSPFYKQLFRDHNIDIASIRTIDDLESIPFTEKEDLQNSPEDFVCVEKGKIIDYTTTSGTLGKPVVIPQTENDLERLALNEANSFQIATGTKNDVFQLTTTINKQFMAGLAYFLGVRKMGAGIIRMGPGSMQMQWQNILDLKPTALIIVPSFLAKMIDYAIENGIDYKSSNISKAVCIGEAIRNQDFSLNTLGRRIKERWDINLFSTYASTEMATAFTECEAGRGGHHQPDLIITEIVDDNGNRVADGEPGELVITTLGIEGYPLVRFKTGDICIKHTEQCSCGRRTYRLGPVLGRKKQMIKYKGTTLYPTAIYDILDGLHWIDAYQIQLKTDNNGCDDVVLNINEITTEQLAHLKFELEAKLRVTPRIELRNGSDLNKIIFLDGYRKPVKFSDLRTPKN